MIREFSCSNVLIQYPSEFIKWGVSLKFLHVSNKNSKECCLFVSIFLWSSFLYFFYSISIACGVIFRPLGLVKSRCVVQLVQGMKYLTKIIFIVIHVYAITWFSLNSNDIASSYFIVHFCKILLWGSCICHNLNLDSFSSQIIEYQLSTR